MNKHVRFIVQRHVWGRPFVKNECADASPLSIAVNFDLAQSFEFVQYNFATGCAAAAIQSWTCRYCVGACLSLRLEFVLM